jgi:NADPH-dependent glutamate synthase beta subunit-like oxidoreductase
MPDDALNTLVADRLSYATRVPGVFAGGDVATGPSVAIDCIAAAAPAGDRRYLIGHGNGEVNLSERAHGGVQPHTARTATIRSRS